MNDGTSFKRFFTRNDQLQRYMSSYIKKPLVLPHFIDFHFFKPEQWPFVETLTQLGLKDFTSQSEKRFYLELIKVFYCNLKFHKDENMYYEVKGVPIKLSVKEFANICKLTTGGVRLYEKGKIKKFNKDLALKKILREGAEIKDGNVLASDLSLQNRMLHFVLVNVIAPTEGNHVTITNHDLMVLWHMYKYDGIDWLRYIIDHIQKADIRELTALPSGMLIKNFLQKFEVDFKSEGYISKCSNHVIDAKTLNHMSIKQVDGVWVRVDERKVKKVTLKKTSATFANNTNAGTSQANLQIVPSSDIYSILGAIQTSINNMKIFMEDSIIGLNGRLDTLSTQVADLSSQVENMEPIPSVHTAEMGH